MSSYRAVLLAVLVVVGTALAAPFAGAVGVADVTDAQGDEDADADANETSVGAQVSSFMQTSSANATSEVENGMFEAEYESADNRTALVDRRADSIEQRIADLRERKRQLTERKGEMHPVAYDAQMSRIVAELDALERQIDDTRRKAEAAGADPARFDRLRENASSLRGPETAAAARSIPGRGPPDDRTGEDDRGGQGPPDDAGDDRPGDQTADEQPNDHPSSGDQGSDDEQSGAGTGNGNDGSSDDGPGGGSGGDRPLLGAVAR